VDKIAEKEVCTSVFLTIIALYFECRINKNALLQWLWRATRVFI